MGIKITEPSSPASHPNKMVLLSLEPLPGKLLGRHGVLDIRFVKLVFYVLLRADREASPEKGKVTTSPL